MFCHKHNSFHSRYLRWEDSLLVLSSLRDERINVCVKSHDWAARMQIMMPSAPCPAGLLKHLHSACCPYDAARLEPRQICVMCKLQIRTSLCSVTTLNPCLCSITSGRCCLTTCTENAVERTRERTTRMHNAQRGRFCKIDTGYLSASKRSVDIQSDSVKGFLQRICSLTVRKKERKSPPS